MQSRMDKYYETSTDLRVVNENNVQTVTVAGSRTKRNQQLYKEVSQLEIEDFDVNSNVSVIGESSATIDIDQIRDMLDKKYREEPKNKSIGSSSIQSSGVNLDETREYDLKSIMEKAKSDKEVNYEEERLKKLGNTSYDILKSLDIYNKDDDEEEIEKNVVVDKPEGYAHEDTIAEVFETKISSKDAELQSLINTITAKELLQFDESTKDLDPLDILSDLRGDDDQTRVMGALSFGDTAQVETTPVVSNQSVSEETMEEENFLDDTEEVPTIASKNENNIKKQGVDTREFDDFKDLRDDGNILVKILVFLIIVLLVIGCVVFANKFLELGLF